MKVRLRIVLSLLVVGCTALALRHDLSQWRLDQGDRAFRRGELKGAIVAWSSPAIERSSRQCALLNRGVARYRLGDLATAGADFREAAATSGNSHLRQRALYNLGTTLLVMERERKRANRQEAERLLTEAVQSLQAAVELDPADADAEHNGTVARARLAVLIASPSAKQPGASPGHDEPTKGTEGKSASPPAAKTGSEGKKSGEATDRVDPAGRRRAATPLSQEQALRMLDDARGREALRSGVAAGSSGEKLVPPEKDW